jgi:agmatinase
MSNLKTVRTPVQKDDKGQIALIGFPFDEYSSHLKGTADAPPLIRQAFRSDATNTWSEGGMNLGEPGIIVDARDVAMGGKSDYSRQIEQSIARLLERRFSPIALGGDHSVTYPIIKAFHRKFPDLHILLFDAHPDLYDEFQGNRFSHACPFARIMEAGLAKRLVEVGIRAMNGHQRRQAEKFGVEVIAMQDWQDDRLLEFTGPLYISVDMDALDPAFAPGVSHLEPGGFTTRQVITAIQRIKAPAIVGADIVEFNPRRDPLGVTAAAAAKILKEIAAKMLSR